MVYPAVHRRAVRAWPKRQICRPREGMRRSTGLRGDAWLRVGPGFYSPTRSNFGRAEYGIARAERAFTNQIQIIRGPPILC